MKVLSTITNKEIFALVLVVLFLFLYAIFVALPATNFLVHVTPHDFDVYYDAGQEVLIQGSHSHLYELEKPLDMVADKGNIYALDNYIYPPLFAVLFSPLTILSLDTASIIAKVFNIALLITSVILLTKNFFPKAFQKSLSPYTITAIGLLSFFLIYSQPAISALANNQVSIFLLFLFSLFIFSYSKRKKKLSALLIGLASAIKLFPAIFMIYFIIKKDWKTLGWTILLGAIFTLAPLPLVGWHNYDTFFRQVLPILRLPSADYHTHSLPAVLARFFGPSEYFQPWITSPFIIYIGTAVATAILIICLCLWVKKYNDVFLIVSLIITVTLIISPVSWLHYFTLASIPFLFIIFQIKSRLKEIPLYIILLAALAIGLIFLMPPDDFPGFSLVTSTYGLASSAITLFLLIYLAKDKCFTVFQPPTKAGAGTTRTNTLWWSKWRL